MQPQSRSLQLPASTVFRWARKAFIVGFLAGGFAAIVALATP